ncbi:MAG: hypothetical protein CMF79_00835 [Candidatus Marinimicrobia bacterium]|nr:hypothetical protein [Candidatus Neomarinimicrobiota bacterium]|tara:strand:+ start:26694 stop:26888 length:195 start_codon:yes stop_codon:yes gene_type:complete
MGWEFLFLKVPVANGSSGIDTCRLNIESAGDRSFSRSRHGKPPTWFQLPIPPVGRSRWRYKPVV